MLSPAILFTALKQLLSQGVLDKLQKKENYKYDNERFKPSRYNEEALNKLLSENVLDKKIQPRHKLVPNTLLGSFELENDRTEDRNNLGGYSKVYVILNPEAIAKSTNKQKLNDLLTKVLSLTAPSGLERKNRNRPKKYKGFSIVPEVLSRRARRESREMYGKDSIEEDYRPKRQRGERGGGGGGGGAGGRTAIPYIRHRGDIYERDN
ncbi:hypothetical protein ABMA28_007117 [Loxostege sticticalis]|uniref:Uncharacterized protein n=1 Tax=Loxostege sticticalis TaxID=481309 RepID=A0ABD0TPW1_LOXSC